MGASCGGRATGVACTSCTWLPKYSAASPTPMRQLNMPAIQSAVTIRRERGSAYCSRSMLSVGGLLIILYVPGCFGKLRNCAYPILANDYPLLAIFGYIGLDHADRTC